MTHLDGDTLALVALAELELSAAETEHLSSCPACAGELDALRRTVLIGRSAGSVDLVDPADAVWGRIHAALGLSDTVAAPPRLADLADPKPADADARAGRSADADVRATSAADQGARRSTADQNARGSDAAQHDAREIEPASEPAPEPSIAAVARPASAERPASAAPEDRSSTAASRPPASVVDLPARRRRAWLPVAAAACAVGIVGGIAAGVWWQSARTPASEPVIAEAQLDALPGWAASGSASVEETADGRRDVVVDLSADESTDGLREVWLLTADATGLVSLGLLDGPTGRFSIPAGVDLAEFPVVDVSAEPVDGNPAHSGDSIVRGTLSEL